MVSEKADRPALANLFLSVLKLLMRHAVEMGFRPDDPTVGVRGVKNRSTGYRTWTEEEIEIFYAAWAPGTRERLAMELLLCTGQRRADDVIRMGRQHVRDGKLEHPPIKERQRSFHPDFGSASKSHRRSASGAIDFLADKVPQAVYRPKGFADWFHEAIMAAGLPKGLSSHGLRKASCRRLAEAGCTPHQIASISGHKSLREIVTIYQAADRVALAVSAMATLNENRTGSVKPH